jgi:hypothetical protein
MKASLDPWAAVLPDTTLEPVEVSASDSPSAHTNPFALSFACLRIPSLRQMLCRQATGKLRAPHLPCRKPASNL